MKNIINALITLIALVLSHHTFSEKICNWYDTQYPVCQSKSYGWGWENKMTCVGQHSCQGDGRSIAYSQACNWHGSNYPICDAQTSGWGWENNTSCVGKSSCAGNGRSIIGDDSGQTGSHNQCPKKLNCPAGMSCGCYKVSGLGKNKRAYRAAGANDEFLASAMIETDEMDTNYAWGDNKRGAAFNAGATKQNWDMMRQCHKPWQGKKHKDFALSAELNKNKRLDVQVYKACRKHFGDKWFAGHRNGASGLKNPNTSDIKRFIRGYNWTLRHIRNGHQTDDLRFWVQIPAI